MKLATIGFTQKSAREFFALLAKAGVRRVIDVRRNNTSQLAGFAKRDDLEFFLQAVGGIEYVHLDLLTPTQEMLDAYRKEKGSWADYEKSFLRLLGKRRVDKRLKPATFENACLLCSEDSPNRCHRRVIAEYLARKWGNLEVVHLF